MDSAIFYDCEFLTAPGAPQRFWCGPCDPDPVIAQIGAVRLGLSKDFPILEAARWHVLPRGRDGARLPLDPLFVRLTGITEAVLDAEGLPLAEALGQLDTFAGGAPFWSWGKDEFNMLAISCYVAGITPPIPATRFGNAARLLLAAGVPHDEIVQLRSDRLADHFDIAHTPLRGHDALDDAKSVAFTLQHLLRDGRLRSDALTRPVPGDPA
ncbi:exonuclease [Sulfitobacter sp. D35]|uniref:exonuclease n=1 Tax=Sulfitobacter sp. D35 TaxID=3083252 RepID=UPI00296EDD0A|nr:exonuclease [Sulfitobacter sp. D35]MDW4496758.1 exonuclease [Sulfitobacter sp. D35]